MATILYLTLESLENDPIIRTQVIPLAKKIDKKYNFKTITLEKNDYILKQPIQTDHIFIIRKNFIISLLHLLAWLFRNRKEYDLIHVRSYAPMYAAIPAGLLLKKPIIFDMRGVMAHEFWMRVRTSKTIYKKAKYSLLSTIFLLSEYIFVNISDCIIVVSEAFRDYIQGKVFKKKKIITIPTFSSTLGKELFPKDIPFPFQETGNSPIFVYSGSLEVWQQFNKTIELFSYIQKENPNARLLILTTYVDKAMAIALSLLPRYSFEILSVSSDLVPYYLSKCDFGFLLRSPDLVNRVAAPIKFAEYLSAGLRVILTSGIGDASDQTNRLNLGFVIPNLNSETLKKFVYNNINEFTHTKKNHQNSIVEELLNNNYRIDQAARKYSEVYKMLIK